jgi:tetratricopeptide (TPR) repeat protein
MRAHLAALLSVFLAAPARAVTPIVDGEYESPLGRLRIVAAGQGYRGTLVLTGAVHVAKGCVAPIGERGGLSLARVRAGATAPSAAGRSVRRAAKAGARAEARALLRDGAAHLAEGSFEAARRRFEEAIAVDAQVPEAYNGVGVTYRMRNDLGAALDWYKKALGVDPDFGDAYYNMACVYALRGDTAMALRYLQIAALNGYATGEGMDADPDLATLRAEPAYRALVRARM